MTSKAQIITYQRPTLAQYQLDAIFCPERYALIEATTKAGKAQPLDAKLYTPKGFVLMSDAEIGLEVLTPKGKAKIVGIYPQGLQDVLRITFSDGSTTECTKEHLWEIHHERKDYRRGFASRLSASPDMRRRKDFQPFPRVMSLEELQTYKQSRTRLFYLPEVVADFDEKPTLIDSYLLGLLIGDGSLSNGAIKISSVDEEILESIRKVLPENHELKHNHKYDYVISINKHYNLMPERMHVALRELGLLGTKARQKHIPDSYKFNSIQVRQDVLAGIFDTDGWVDKHGQPVITQTSKRLAQDIADVVRSLGGLCKQSEKTNQFGQVYTTRLLFDNYQWLSKLPRKAERLRGKIKPLRRNIKAIEYVGQKECQCIKIDDERSLYLTDDFIPTHNTVGCLAWIIEQALQGKANQNFWWVAPVYEQAKIAYRRLKNNLTREIFKPNESELSLLFLNGARIICKSGEKPDNLYGEDVFAAVLDEASRMREESWFALRSTLTATKAPVRIIGNVKGRKNWFYRLARRAEAGEPNMRYQKITAFDAIEAKILDEAEIEDARRTLPKEVFEELYLAIPTEDGSNPFGITEIQNCITPLSTKEPVCFGIDLAKSHDWTVITGLDEDGNTSYFERYQKSWNDTIDDIRAKIKKPAFVDSTGVGDAVLESLQKGRNNFFGYKFTSTSKQQLMEALRLAIHQRAIGFPDGVIVDELEMFEYAYTRTGVRYAAPEGAFDDCVCSLALAVEAQSQPAFEITDRERSIFRNF